MSFNNYYNNINLWIKHTFLSFAQGYFSVDPKFTWNIDPRTTKLIIADKFAVDLGVIDKKPAIILSRGSYGWTDTIRGSSGENSVLLSKKANVLAPAPTADRWANFIFTDMLRGSVTYNVLSKNGVEAEEIANRLFTALSGYKNELKKYGIHSTMGLTLGDERIVKTTSEIEAMGVTVSLGFMAQKSIEKAMELNEIEATMLVPRITTTGMITQGVSLFENIDYEVINDGTQIEFLYAPAAETLGVSISYTDAISLNVITSLLAGTYDGVNRVFTVVGGKVHGYYKLNTAVITSGTYSVSGLVDYLYEMTPSGLVQTDEIGPIGGIII